jgi:transcriptional regulator with XRE-family HTH domain
MYDEKTLLKLLGERIRRLRRMQSPEMSPERLGQVLGLTRTSITNIERGKQKITLDTLYTLCDTFSVEVSDLLPALKEVAIPSKQQVVVGNRTFDVPPKTAELMNTLAAASTAVGVKRDK